MATSTTNFGFTKPGVNDPIDANQWGFQLNTNFDLDDTLHNRWLTNDIGTSRPSDAKAGTMWIDNTTSPWVLYVYDGTNDISMGTIDTTNNEFNPSNGSSPSIITLASDYIFNWNTTNNVVTGFSFPTLANKKYTVRTVGECQPSVGWSTNSNNTNMSLEASNYSLYGGGTYYRYQSVTPSYVWFVLPPNNTFGALNVGQVSNRGSSTAALIFYSEVTIQAPNVDSVFQVLASWTSAGGSTSSGTMIIKAGATLTYQELN